MNVNVAVDKKEPKEKKTKKIKTKKTYLRNIWLSLAGLILIPYPFVLLCGMLANHYAIVYMYADLILYTFMGLIVLFLVLLIVTIVQYRGFINGKGNRSARAENKIIK